MGSSFKKATLTWTVALLALALVSGCSSLNKPMSNEEKQKGSSTGTQQKTTIKTPGSSSSRPSATKSIVFKNTQYGFQFTLPASWTGYSIITGKWQGNDVKSGKITETGPMISIRHPHWASQKPRQDIPIMVFSHKQWNSLQQEIFHIGAAPIGPSELGRNNKYVFALPARYNYAFPTGYPEVEEILKNKPLRAI